MAKRKIARLTDFLPVQQKLAAAQAEIAQLRTALENIVDLTSAAEMGTAVEIFEIATRALIQQSAQTD